MTLSPDPNRMHGLIDIPPDGPIWEWAEANIIIPARTPTNFPGAYRSDLAIYTRDILDLLKEPGVNTLVFEKGAQIAATITATVALAYWSSVDPGPAMLVYSSEDIARSQSETRVMPIFEDSPALAALIPDDWRSCWTKLQYRLRKNVVNWQGSHSPANLASRAVRYLILDEVDKYPAQSGEEADPVSLAIQRTKTYGNRRKVFIMSTPTSSEGQIHRHYTSGDRRRLYVPCPRCGLMQILSWPQVRFDSDLPISDAAAGAFYECPGCKFRIMDGHKAEMLKRREWRATAKSTDPTLVSIHLSSLYSPWVTWAYLVRAFLKAKSDPKQLQDFINSELGEPFDKRDAHIESDQLLAREGGYKEGEVWITREPYAHEWKDAVEDSDFATLVWADTQKGYLVAVVRTFAKNGDSGLVWHGELSGFEALEELRVKHHALVVGIDHNYRGPEVREWVYDHRHDGYLVTMGSSRRLGTMTDKHALNIDEGKRGGGRGGTRGREILELTIDPDQAKDVLEKCIAGDATCPRWMIPTGLSMNPVYGGQMQSEQRVAGKWEQIGDRENHRWDAESCLIAMAVRMGFWEWRGVKPTDKDGESK